MSDLVENVLGGFLAAIAAGGTASAWKRLRGPHFITNQIGDVADEFPHLPIGTGGVMWHPLFEKRAWEAKGWHVARTRFLRKEIRCNQPGNAREDVLMIRPPS